MFDILAGIVFALGVLGLIIGLAGEPTFLVSGSVLIAGALIAAAVRSLGTRK